MSAEPTPEPTPEVDLPLRFTTALSAFTATVVCMTLARAGLVPPMPEEEANQLLGDSAVALYSTICETAKEEIRCSSQPEP